MVLGTGALVLGAGADVDDLGDVLGTGAFVVGAGADVDFGGAEEGTAGAEVTGAADERGTALVPGAALVGLGTGSDAGWLELELELAFGSGTVCR